MIRVLIYLIVSVAVAADTPDVRSQWRSSVLFVSTTADFIESEKPPAFSRVEMTDEEIRSIDSAKESADARRKMDEWRRYDGGQLWAKGMRAKISAGIASPDDAKAAVALAHGAIGIFEARRVDVPADTLARHTTAIIAEMASASAAVKRPPSARVDSGKIEKTDSAKRRSEMTDVNMLWGKYEMVTGDALRAKAAWGEKLKRKPTAGECARAAMAALEQIDYRMKYERALSDYTKPPAP